MKKYYICLFAAFLMLSCGKTELSKKKRKNNDVISAQLSKIINKSNIAEINSLSLFSSLVIERGKTSAILFYSDESAPCVYIKKFFAEVAKNSSNNILFVQINLSDKPSKVIGTKYNIFSVPTLVLFNHGKEFNRLVDKTNIEKFKFL
jgi:thiol-disulfide isomerase/thioredoxin